MSHGFARRFRASLGVEMTEAERIEADLMAMTVALRLAVAFLSPDARASLKASAQAALETAETGLLYSRLSDAQRQRTVATLARELGLEHPPGQS